MNFLAHTYLSCSNEDLLLGNFLADFLKDNEIQHLPKSFLIGIDLHRKIDSFTDEHPAVLEVNKLFHETHRKYAPVVTDVLFDLVLARNWKHFHRESLEKYTEEIYDILLKHQDHFPTRRKQTILNMINGGFLMKYTDIEGLKFTFDHLDRRTKGRGNFAAAIENINKTYPSLEEAFHQFFPELIQEVEEFCNC